MCSFCDAEIVGIKANIFSVGCILEAHLQLFWPLLFALTILCRLIDVAVGVIVGDALCERGFVETVVGLETVVVDLLRREVRT